jgi:hypothetical protein
MYANIVRQTTFLIFEVLLNLSVFKNSVVTSQETYHVTATKPSLLMRFIVRTIRNTQIYINSVRTSQETHYVSAIKPNRLMLFGETVAVCCEKHTEHTDIYIIYKLSSYLTGNTSRLRYKAKPVNAVWGNSRCFLFISGVRLLVLQPLLAYCSSPR